MVTINDVAQQAGVARPTASLVLGGKRGNVRIPDETRERVLLAAHELGYRPNELARAVISGHNKMLGFLVAHPEAEATARMLGGALDEADRHGYSLKVLRLAQAHQVDRATIERCVELRLAGVMAIYLDDPSLHQLHVELARHAMPIAVLERGAPAWGVGVISDDRQAMGLAVSHLVQAGHRRIAFLTLDGHTSFRGRVAAFEEAMRQHGLPVARGAIVPSARERSELDNTARTLLSKAQRPTAVIGATDPVAMAVLRVASQLGLRVPHDVSVVGYGDLEMTEHANPTLTSVALPFLQIGQVAVRRLVERIGNKVDEQFPLDELLPARLVVRDSSGPAV